LDYKKRNRLIQTFLILIVKILVALVLIRIATRRLNLEDLTHVFRYIHLKESLLILLLILSNWSLQIWRWQRLLRNNALNVPLGSVIKSHFSGYSFRLLVPGGYAEFLKIYMINGKKLSGLKAFGAEVLLVGAVQLILMALAGMQLFPAYRTWSGLAFVLGIAVLGIFPFLKHLPLLQKPLSGSDFRYRQIFPIISITLASLALIITQYHMILSWFDGLDWFNSARVILFLIGSGLVPFTFAGLGIRENVAIYLFGLYGINAGDAVSISLFVFTTNILLPAFIGMLFIVGLRLRLFFKPKELLEKSTL
jgi:uncharacterized membrane protein YbhN (UPF0104 family)